MYKAVALASATILMAGCTETLVVDETGRNVLDVQDSYLGGPDGVIDPGEELRGRVVQVNTGTTINRFIFRQDGMFFIEAADGGRMVQGTYVGRGDEVCVTWAPRGTECWPRAAMLSREGPVTVTSDRGQTMTVRLIDS